MLTGDLVRSTDLTPDALRHAIESVEQCAKDLAPLIQGALQFSRHRGDGWQVALQTPKFALRTMLAIRAQLRSNAKRGFENAFDTRIAAATGPAVLPLKPDLNEESQEVFIRSGRALDALGKADLQLTADQDARFAATLRLADYISRQWTGPQAQAIYQSLIAAPTPTDTAIGKALGKSRQTVARALHGAGQAHILAALAALEEVSP